MSFANLSFAPCILAKRKSARRSRARERSACSKTAFFAELLAKLAEGANMPATLEAAKAFVAARVLYAPGKASNAGGVAVSGLEMAQNSARLSWTREEVDARLHAIMRDIHENCVRHGHSEREYVNYLDGANIAGFVKVADAMRQQGLY